MMSAGAILRQLAFGFYLKSEQAAEDYCDEVVDGRGCRLQVDRVLSVSGLVEVEDDCDYDPTHNELNALCVDPSIPSVEVS